VQFFFYFFMCKLGITLRFGDMIAYVVTNVRIIVTEEIMN